MASIKDELDRIAAERVKLAQQEKAIIAKRESEIGAMFGKAGLVHLEDAVILGVLAELKAEQAGSARLQQLAQKGGPDVAKKPGRKAAT